MYEDFRARQYAFAAHLRNPETHPAPDDIEERRMAIYRELFFNNISSLLAGTFPVLHRLLADRWAVLVRAFYHRHVSHTPLFMEVPREFLAWLDGAFENDGTWPPFMQELAHYEWVELALSVDPREITDDNIDRDGNLLDGAPVLSPVAWPLAYRFPVHRIGPEFQPQVPDAQPTFIVVYRRRDDSVGFTVVNAVTARLLELLQEAPDASGRELLTRIAAELGNHDPAVVITGGEQVLKDLHRQDIVLGTKVHEIPY